MPPPRHSRRFCASLYAQIGAAPLLRLVDEAADAGFNTSAAALARGLLASGGAATAADGDISAGGESALVGARFGFGGLHDLALACFERGAVGEGAEILGGSRALQLAALRLMLSGRRCLGLAAQYLPAAALAPMPPAAALASLGAEAAALVSGSAEAAIRAEAARAAVEAALRTVWPGAVVRVYGSSAIGTAGRNSDVDLCALIPPAEGAAAPTPLTLEGRALLAPMLEKGASALRHALGCLRGAVRLVTTYSFTSRLLSTTISSRHCPTPLAHTMNEARLSHLPFWGPSEAVFFLIKRPSG